VRELLEDADRAEGATVLLARRLPNRGQKKIRTYKKRVDGKLGIELSAIEAEYPGLHVLFQIRQGSAVGGTATWHVPGEAAATSERTDLAERSDHVGDAASDEARQPLAVSLAPALAELTAFAEVRAENKLLAEEVRTLRTQVERYQLALADARAERKEAVRARKRVEGEMKALRTELSEAENLTWMLRIHMGEHEWAEATGQSDDEDDKYDEDDDEDER